MRVPGVNVPPTIVPDRRTIARTVAIELIVNVGAPYAVYAYLDGPLGDVRALLASSAPPIVWSIVEFIRRRRVDALSLLVLVGIVLSLLAFLGGGSVRALQFRENLVGAFVGVAFLGSLLVRRPLIYELARASIARASAAESTAFTMLRAHPRFRRAMTTMTWVWGLGLLAQTAVAFALIVAMPIRDYLIAGPIFGYASFGALGWWTFLYARQQRRAREAETAKPED